MVTWASDREPDQAVLHSEQTLRPMLTAYASCVIVGKSLTPLSLSLLIYGTEPMSPMAVRIKWGEYVKNIAWHTQGQEYLIYAYVP